jgi:hypothetical protein
VKIIRNYYYFIKNSQISLFVFLFFIPSNLFAQTNSIQTGSTNSLKVSLSNTFGVSTSAIASENLIVNNKASLILEEGSTIQDTFGDGDSQGESVAASFDISPNGSNVSVSGLQAQNNYIIGPGSEFISTMETKEGNTTAQNGDASANMYHDMALKVEQTNSSFTSSFSQNF